MPIDAFAVAASVCPGRDFAGRRSRALAERLATVNIATLDERHFRSVRPLAAGDVFRLLPMDATPA